MKIQLMDVTVGEVCQGYVDNNEEGVVGYGGMLNIRPKYQREFIYGDKQRNAVIETINKGFPLNVMYWVKNNEGEYEVLDGQQRTLSFCKYVNGDFSLNEKYFYNLTDTEKQTILNYKLLVYVCEGNDKEKLSWFRIINIAGEPLTEQELRNATYTGTWLESAKKYFSKTNCAAYNLAKDYVNGKPLRQEFLETALRWKSNGNIEDYMAKNQRSYNANELWTYFRNVIEWVKTMFTVYRKEMKGIDWGALYDRYGNNLYDTDALESKIAELMADDDVTNKKDIYAYVLTGNEKYLNIRQFTATQKRTCYEKQNGICAKCGKHFELSEMDADHITPWSKGGKTELANCQMLCVNCNRVKSNK